MMRRLVPGRGPFVIVLACGWLWAIEPRAQCTATPMFPGPNVRTASNCHYDTAVNVGFIDGAGAFTAATGRLHPVSQALGMVPVVLGDGVALTPFSDGFSLRLWDSQTDYLLHSAQFVALDDGPFHCWHDLLLSPPTWEEFADPSSPAFGVRATFETIGAPDRLNVTIEIAAHGDAFETSAVRSTLTVRNAGPIPLRLGARFAVAPEIEGPRVAVGVAPPDPPAEPLVSGDAQWIAPNIDHVVISETGQPSLHPSLYFAAASVVGPWTMQPPATPPDRLGTSTGGTFPGEWGVPEHCFGWTMRDPPISRPGGAGIESMGWFWGDTPETARVLAPGEETSFTVWFWAYFENPVACDAGGPYGPVECAGAATSIELDASNSRTQGGSSLLYRWSSVPGVVIDDPSSASPVLTFPGPGTWPVTLDTGVGPFTRQCTTTVEVVDTTPPSLHVPPPIILRTSELGGACRSAQSLVATATDACGGPVTITHVTIPDVGTGGGEVLHDFGAGTTRVMYTAADAAGNVATAEASVTILDDTPPVFARKQANPSELWPPNHRLVPVTVDLDVTDSCDAAPAVELVGIISSEPADARGDGRTGPDIAFAHAGRDDREFRLRAERDGRGAGREYRIEYLARDAAGNEAREATVVVVAHDRRAR